MLTETIQNPNATAIKIRMLQLGITQSELAKALGVSRSAVSHVIAGRKSSKTIRRALEILQVNKKTNLKTFSVLSKMLTCDWCQHWGFRPDTVRKSLRRHAVSPKNPLPKPPRRLTISSQICRAMAETISQQYGWQEAQKIFPYFEPLEEEAKVWLEQGRLRRLDANKKNNKEEVND